MSLRRRTSWARVEGPELVLEIDPMDGQGQLKKKRGYVVMGKIRGCSPTEDHQACRSTNNRQPQGSKEQFEGDRGLRGAIKKVPADPHPETRIGTSSFQTRLRNRSGLAL